MSSKSGCLGRNTGANELDRGRETVLRNREYTVEILVARATRLLTEKAANCHQMRKLQKGKERAEK